MVINKNVIKLELKTNVNMRNSQTNIINNINLSMQILSHKYQKPNLSTRLINQLFFKKNGEPLPGLIIENKQL